MEFIIGIITGIIITIIVSLKIVKKITGDENYFNKMNEIHYERLKNCKDIEENNEYDKRIENWKNETK